MKYLIDEALIVESLVQDEVNEATGKKEKNYYIEGIFSTPDQKNRNGRIYPLSLWEKEVAKYQEEIKNNSMNTLGEWEHPARTTVDPLEAVMRIVELKIEDGLVKGKAKILNNNSQKTNQLKALIDEGYKIGVSSRGTGSVKGEYVENFNLTTYDAVSSPSDYNANLVGLCESLESSVVLETAEVKEDMIPDDQIVEIEQSQIQTDIVETKKELSDFEKKIAQEKFMDKFSKLMNSIKSKEIGSQEVLDESIFSTTGKDAHYLMDAAVKSIKGMINELEKISKKDLKSAKTEAKKLADEVEKLFDKCTKEIKS